MQLTETHEEAGEWNRSLELNPGETLYNELSELCVWITLLDKEWQVRHKRQSSGREQSHWLQRRNLVLPGSDVELARFVRPDNDRHLRLQPKLADRAMVIRPYHPFYLMPQGECTIYVSTVLWLQVRVGASDHCLMEMPVQVPSLTWLGRNTQEGELCYASGTAARLALEAVPRRPWRAITSVRIHNRSKEPLKFERFSLPTAHLPLFRAERGLWTPEITVTCGRDLTTAQLDISDEPPAVAGAHALESAARDPVGRGGLVRALDRIFG